MDAHNQQDGMWQTRDQITEHLGIANRTLTDWCDKGKVERRKVGRRCVYRLPTGATANTGARNNSKPAHGLRHRGTQPAQFALAPVNQEESVPNTSTEAALLVGLVEQLTAELSAVNAQRGEAIGIGHMLADERDSLRARVEALESRLAQLLASPRSVLVRRQLLDILTTH